MKKNIPLTVRILTILSCLAGTGLAGTHTWSGAGGNALWSNAANWSSGGVPTAGEAAPVKLIFPANAVSRTSTLNISNLKIDAIEINTTNGAYTFPNGGISTTFTGAAGDNILITGASNETVWQPAVNLQSTCRFNVAYVGSTIDFQGIIGGSGGITKTGPGVMEFSTGGAANTFTGTLRHEGGILNLNKIAGTPCFGGNLEIVAGTVRVLRSHQIPDSAVITMTAGYLTITREPGAGNTYEAVGAINVSGNSTITVISPNSLGLSGNVTCDNNASARLSISASSGAQIDFSGATRTFAVPHADSLVEITGLINGNGTNAGLTKTGAGKLRLMSENTLNGPFAIHGGVLDIRNAGALGSTSGSTTISAGASMNLGSLTLPAESIALAGSITTDPGSGAEILGNISLSGNPVLSSNSTNLLKLSGVISGSPTEVTIPNGIIEFAGSSANTYTGITRVLSNDIASLVLNKSAGTAVNGDIHIGYRGSVKSLKSHQINDGASIRFETGGWFNLNSQTESVNSVSSAPDAFEPRIDLGDGSLTMVGNSSYQLGNDSSTKRCIIHGSSVSSFRKQGTGIFTLVHSGGIASQQSTLYLHSGILDLRGGWMSPIQVLGGLLKGTAQTGNVSADGGDIAFDKFTSTSLTNTGAGGNLIFALNGAIPGTGFARVTVSGALNLTGIQLQSSLDFLPRTDASFTLIDNNGPGPVTGTFNGLPEGSLLTIGDQPFRISYQGGPEGKDVVLYFIGEGYGYPEVVLLSKLADASVKIEVEGMPGETVVLQYNTVGLTGNWATLKTMVLDANGKGSHIRWNNNLSREFYRLSYTK